MVFLLCIFLVTSGVKNEEEILKYKNYGEIKKLQWVNQYGRRAQGFESWAKFKKDLQSILTSFDLNVIKRYFSEYEDDISIGSFKGIKQDII